MLAVLLALAILALVGCDTSQLTAPPAPPPTATPAPRPTAEPPAAVAGWYLAAQAEEPVRVWADLTPREVELLTEAFGRRYPNMSIQWTRAPDAELFAAALSGVRAGANEWDVYIGDSAPTLKSLRLAQRWTPPEARAVPGELLDGEGAWYAVAATYHVLQYNTDQVPFSSRPTTYEMLRHPGYFGRLAVLDEDLTWLRGLVEARGQDAAVGLLRPLAQQAVATRRDARTLSAFVTAGAYAVAIDNRLDVVERDRRGGGKTAWLAVEPVVVQPLAMVVAAASDRPNAARLAANFLLSRDAQTVLAEGGRVPSRLDVSPEPPTLVHGLRTHVTLPPEGTTIGELRTLWSQIWSGR